MPKIKNPLTIVQSGGSDKLFKSLVDGSITTVTAEDLGGLTSFRLHGFRNSNLESIVIPASITTLYAYCLMDCVHLVNVTFEDSPTALTLYEAVFRGDPALTSITLPNRISELPIQTFFDCSALKEAIIEGNLSFVAGQNFQGCRSLDRIVFYTTLDTKLQGTSAFTNTNDCLIFFPLNKISWFKTATNWVTYASRMRPIVDTVADLSTIDTTEYTNAWVKATKKQYNYDGSNWNEVT